MEIEFELNHNTNVHTITICDRVVGYISQAKGVWIFDSAPNGPCLLSSELKKVVEFMEKLEEKTLQEM